MARKYRHTFVAESNNLCMTTVQFTSLRSAAITIGVGLIVMAIMAGYAFAYAFTQLYNAQDAALTFQHHQANPSLLSGFLWGFIAIGLLDVLVAVSVYRYFAAAQPTLARWSAAFRGLYVVGLGIALAPVLSVWHSDSLTADMLQTGLQLFLRYWTSSLVIFGLHLALLGYMSLRTRALPIWISALLVFAGAAYSITNLADCMLPSYAQLYKPTVDALLGAPMALSELSLAVWLLWKGGRK